jgi:tetratricopeptide (TPR) repeat protein
MGKARRRKIRGSVAKGVKRPIPEDKGILSPLDGRYGFAVALVIITVTAFLIYSSTFSFPFHFDDTSNIVENHKLRNLKNFWPPSGTRYIGFLSFAINYHLEGLDVFGYHLVNIIIHIINGFLLWCLVIITFKTPVMGRATINPQFESLIALTASLIFITHPVQTQAVTYIVQRFGVGSLLTAVLAMKTKEITFTLPFIVLLYEFMFFDTKVLTRKNLLYIIPFLLTVLIIPLSLTGIDKPLGDVIGELGEAAQETEAIPRGVYLLTQFRVIATYIRLLFLPVNQNLDYAYPLYNSLFEPGVFFSFLFLLSIFGLAIYLFKRSRRTNNLYALMASFGILWFFITLSVESSVIPIRDVIFEHRLYLPSVGAVIAFGTAVFYGLDYARLRNLLLATSVLLFVTILPLGITAYNRNLVWKGEGTLWEDVVRKSPGKSRGHNNLGVAYSNRGLVDEAIEEYKESLKLNPKDAKAHNNLGLAYYDQGRIDEAIAVYKKAIGFKPDYPKAHNNLGLAYYKQGRMDEAIAVYKKALGFKPDYPKAHNNLGLAYYKQGRIDGAIEEYKESLKLNPNYAKAHNNLGTAYDKKGLIDKAIEEYKESLKLNPKDAKAHNNLGAAYDKKGLIDEAIEEYKLALKFKPDYAEAYNNLGAVYAMKGRMDEAAKEFKKAIKFKPDYAEAHNNLGSAYYNLRLIDEAIEEFKETLRLEPDYAAAHFNLGFAYKAKGLKEEAIREFEQVLKMNPRDRRAHEVLESLSR